MGRERREGGGEQRWESGLAGGRVGRRGGACDAAQGCCCCIARRSIWGEGGEGQQSQAEGRAKRFGGWQPSLPFPHTHAHSPTPPTPLHGRYDAPLPLVQGGKATYFGAEIPFDLGTLTALEFALMAGAESFRGNAEGDKRVYPGGAFDPVGMSKGNLEEMKTKEIKNGERG